MLDKEHLDYKIDSRIKEHIGDLSKEDITQIKAVIEHHGRVRWVLSSLRVWLLTAVAGTTFLTVGLDGIRSILRKFIS